MSCLPLQGHIEEVCVSLPGIRELPEVEITPKSALCFLPSSVQLEFLLEGNGRRFC